MPDKNKRQQLYDRLKSSGYQLPDFQKFDNGLNDPQIRQKLYNQLQSGGYQLPEFKVFDSALGGQATQPKANLPVGFGSPTPTGAAAINAMDVAGRSVTEPFSQGVGQISKGNYAAGIQNVMAAGLTLPFTPAIAAGEFVGSVPGVGPFVKEGLQGIASIPPGVFNAGRNLIQGGLNLAGFTPEKERQLLGQTPEQYKETREASQRLGEVGSYYALPDVLAKTGKAGVNLYKEHPVKATSKPPFATSKQRYLKSAFHAFDRAVPAVPKDLMRIKDRARIAPYLAESQRANPVKVGDVQKGGMEPSVMRQVATERLPEIKQRIWGEQSKIVDPHLNSPLEGGVEEIARSVEKLENIYTKNIDLAAGKSIAEEAAKWRKMKTITVGEATEMLQSLNADLQTFYKKSMEGRAAAEAAAKPIAELEAAARSLRKQIAKTLEKRGENVAFYNKLHNDYGAAIRYEVALERQVVKAENPLPPLFTETGARIYPSKSGTIREIGEHTYGRFFTPDKLLNRALERFAKSDLKVPPTPLGGNYLPPSAMPRGGSPKGFSPLPEGGLTNSAVNAGAKMTEAQAKQVWMERQALNKRVMKLIEEGKIDEAHKLNQGDATQRLKEIVEGYIAKTENKPHKAITPKDIDQYFSK